MTNNEIYDLIDNAINHSDTYEIMEQKLGKAIDILKKEKDCDEKSFLLFYKEKKVGIMKYNLHSNVYCIYNNENNFLENGTGYFKKGIFINSELDISKMFGFINIFKKHNII